jgi:hypothetical protein
MLISIIKQIFENASKKRRQDCLGRHIETAVNEQMTR